MVGRTTWVKTQHGKKRPLVPLSYKKAAGKGWDKEDESRVNGSRRTQGEVRENRHILIAPGRKPGRVGRSQFPWGQQ